MDALGLAAVAAAFGYFATVVLRRYEVLRSIALEVDEELREALNRSLLDTTDSTQETHLLNDVHDRLIRAELRAASLPRRQRERVVGQIGVAQHVAADLLSFVHDDDVHVQVYLQPPIIAAREVIAPLMLPPPLVYRRPAKPRSYPDPERFRAILLRHGSLLDGLNETLEDYGRTHGFDV